MESLPAASKSAIMSEMQALVTSALAGERRVPDCEPTAVLPAREPTAVLPWPEEAGPAADNGSVTPPNHAPKDESAAAPVGADAPAATDARDTAASCQQGQKVEKPAWALSEKEAGAAEKTEEGELLAFAEGLDFDAALASLEDQELAAALQVCL